MKVTYQTCCDVHKSFLIATIVKTTGGIEPSYLKKHFSTFNNSILTFKQWLLDNDCHDVCMESTGKYWVPVFHLLEDEIHVVITNPKWAFRVSNVIVQSLSSPKSVRIRFSSQVPNVYVARLV